MSACSEISGKRKPFHVLLRGEISKMNLWVLRMIHHGTFLYALSPPSSVLIHFQGIRIAGENTNILHILSLEKEDNGAYSCAAINSEGESMSPHLNLSIECEYCGLYTSISMQCAELSASSRTHSNELKKNQIPFYN